MNDGYEEARGRRNWLERLGEKIPGFRGFQDRELRREVDKMQREHLAAAVLGIKGAVRSRAQAYTDAAMLGAMHLFDRLDRRLDGLSQAVRFSDYGATGLFDVIKIGERELEKLYEFDVALLDEIEQLDIAVEKIPAPGHGDPDPAVDEALRLLGKLENRWAGRENIVSGVVKTAG